MINAETQAFYYVVVSEEYIDRGNYKVPILQKIVNQRGTVSIQNVIQKSESCMSHTNHAYNPLMQRSFPENKCAYR